MQDRAPTPGQEGRVLITPEDGSPAFYATVTMADNPTQNGTALNKSSLLKDQTATSYGLTSQAVPDQALQILSKSALFYPANAPVYSEINVNLSTANEGDIIQLPKNGLMVEFLVVKKNYESGLNGTGRVLISELDEIQAQVTYGSSGVGNVYSNGPLDQWLNGDYKQQFPSSIQTAMGSTTFSCTPNGGTSGLSTLSRAVFTPSLTEWGYSNTYANIEGTRLSRLSSIRSNITYSYTRTPKNNNITNSFVIESVDGDGYGTATASSSQRSAFPVFTLPETFNQTFYAEPDGTYHEEQEYESTGAMKTVLGEPIYSWDNIIVGSYVGTGTAGVNNKNQLTFSKPPKAVFISIDNQTSPFSIDQLCSGPIIYGAKTAYTLAENYVSYIHTSWEGNKLLWYYTGSAVSQLNASGKIYFYFAII